VWCDDNVEAGRWRKSRRGTIEISIIIQQPTTKETERERDYLSKKDVHDKNESAKIEIESGQCGREQKISIVRMR
jgi:hypothetical protein